jgi:hypothetical protein
VIGKPEGKRPIGRRRRSWQNNIKMNLKEIVREGVVWICLALNRGRWFRAGFLV